MSRFRLFALLTSVAPIGLVAAGCGDESQSPPSRPIPAVNDYSPDGSMLEPLDLVYVCGNRFLATNGTTQSVPVTYRVVGTGETGGLLLPRGGDEDPGHTETEFETSERGEVELYQKDRLIARRKNEGSPCGARAISASVAALGDPISAGEWTDPFPWPVVALHTSLLPNGRVLSWGFSGDPQVWNPATGEFTSAPALSHEFCSGHSLLSDGRVLVAGGHITNGHGLPDINVFDPGSGQWSASTPMKRGRWYPTNTTLASGEVLILAGRDEQGLVAGEPEIWSRGSLKVLTGANRNLPYYPRAFLAPNGKVFYAGEQQMSRYLNTSGTGSWTSVGNRKYGVRDYGSAVMYDRGKILYVGGGRTTETAETIDLTAAAPAWQWTGSMTFKRRHLNATLLPTGEVLVTGGSSGTGFNDVSLGVHAAEIWDPNTGVWTTLASNAVNRTYHSTSLLLPDGRVLHTGSGQGSGAPDELNAEIFSPPYLFKGPRPSIEAAPAEVAYRTGFTVTTAQADNIAKVSLIRLGSVTHAFDMNQRFMWLPFTRGNGTLAVTAPDNPNDAPPGHYMLFILDGNNVPSAAVILKLGSDAAPPANVPPVANFTSTCGGLTCTFTDKSTDSDGTVTGWSWNFGDGSGTTQRSPSHTFPVTGNYNVTLTATDNETATHQVTKAVSVSSSITLTLTTKTDATSQYVTLRWQNAAGTTVDIWRNGKFLKNTPNDGVHTTVKVFVGPATYLYKICEAGSSVCSNEATAVFQ